MNTHNTQDKYDQYYAEDTDMEPLRRAPQPAQKADKPVRIRKTGGCVVGPAGGGPSGEDVGRLMLKDLCFTWEQMNAGGKETPHSRDIFSAEEKSALVGALHTEEDIREYNIYREIHSALVRMPERFSLARTRAELAFWRLHALLLNFHDAEIAHTSLLRSPRTLSRAQYEELLKRYGREGLRGLCPGGIALLEPEFCPEGTLDERGFYPPPPLPEFDNFSAEKMITLHRTVVQALFDSLAASLRECYALLAGISLIADRVDVPELKTYIQEGVPEDEITLLNKLIGDTPGQIVRAQPYLLGADRTGTESLREEVRRLLRPIELETLKPTQRQKDAAAAFIGDLTNIYRDTGRFFALLEGGTT